MTSPSISLKVVDQRAKIPDKSLIFALKCFHFFKSTANHFSVTSVQSSTVYVYESFIIMRSSDLCNLSVCKAYDTSTTSWNGQDVYLFIYVSLTIDKI